MTEKEKDIAAIVGSEQTSWIDHLDPFSREIFFSGTMTATQDYIFEQAFNESIFSWIFQVVFLIDVILRGIAQVFLCNHPIAGIFICIGMAWSSTEMMAYSILGTALCTWTSYAVANAPMSNVRAGLCGYDGALVGCACWFLLETTSNKLFITAVISIIMGIVASFVNTSSKSIMPVAYSLTVLSLVLWNNQIRAIDFIKTSAPKPVSDNFTQMSIQFVVDASLRGVGQFMFCDTTVGSAFVVAGIAICNRQGAFAAVLGSVVGWLMSLYVLKVSNVVAIRSGLYGYNPAGTCCFIAGAVFFKGISPQIVGLGIIGACLCCLYSVGMIGALSPLPVLTFPFITSTWFILVTRTSFLVNPENVREETRLTTFDTKFMTRVGQYVRREHERNINARALVFKHQGKYDRAEPLYIENLEMQKSNFGESHELTLEALSKLANLYKSQDKYDKAIPLFVECLQKRKASLGEAHNDTILTTTSLADIYVASGKFEEAEPLLLDVVAKSKSLLGEVHPKTLKAINKLANLYDIQCNFNEAENLYFDCLKKRIKLLGENHPDTLVTMSQISAMKKKKRAFQFEMDKGKMVKK